MFDELGYKFETWHNLDIHEFEKNMNDLWCDLIDNNYGCLMFFLMCHGTLDTIDFEQCKRCNDEKCKCKTMKRTQFEDHFQKTQDRKGIATILCMNSCRRKKPRPGK